jgi:Calcineurin-like phosphoesterase
MEFTVGLPFTPSGGCVAFVLLDTCPFITSYLQYNENSEARRVLMYRQLLQQNNVSQLHWFFDEVNRAASRCSNVAVIGHHPIVGGGRHALNPLQQDLRTRFHLDDLFRGVGVDMYVHGHDHLLMYSEQELGGTQYVLSGAGSNIRVGEMEENEAEGYKVNTTKFWAEVGGFTVHSHNATHTQTLFVGPAGGVLYRVLRPVRAKSPNCGPACTAFGLKGDHEMAPFTLAEDD